MSLLNHPNLVSCYRSFVNGPVRSLAASERAALGLTRLVAGPEPLGHHAILLGRIRAQHHEVWLSAGASAAVLRHASRSRNCLIRLSACRVSKSPSSPPSLTRF